MDDQGQGRCGEARKFLASGFSIVIVHLDEHVPALAAVCEEIRSRTLEASWVGAIVTSGAGAGAFQVHYDPEDLVILQVEGTKRWQIFGSPVSHPLRRMPKQSPPETEPIFDEVLERGICCSCPAATGTIARAD